MTSADDQSIFDFLNDKESDFDDDDYFDEDYVYNESDEDDDFDADSKPPSPSTSAAAAAASTSATESRESLYVGKNGHQWSDQPLQRKGRSAAPGYKLYVPAARGQAATKKTPLEIWSCLFDDKIIEQVYQYTQAEITIKLASIKKKQSYHRDTSIVEIRAVIGLLYLAGSLKSGNVDLEELWSDRYGISIFRATMSQHRFAFLLSCFHFDDRSTRDSRRQTDNWAPIRDLWEQFVKNCTDSYSPFTNLTVDEQLLTFRGNAPFRVYMPKKPGKYGIKILMINDAKTFYMFNAIPYVGKSLKERKEAEERKKKKEQQSQSSKPAAAKKPRTASKASKPASRGSKSTGSKSNTSSFTRTAVSYFRKITKIVRGKEKIVGASSNSKLSTSSKSSSPRLLLARPKKPKASTSKSAESKPPKPPSEASTRTASYYVQELSKIVRGTNRNITADNWFCSIPLFDEMLTEKLTMVGTLRRNKPEVPPSFLLSREEGTSEFAFDETKTLVSYCPKKNRNVLLLSTNGLYYTNDVDAKSGKPELINFYNSTKSGTDTFDFLCGTYSTSRKTRRWPMRVFYGMCDQAGVNASILYFLNQKDSNSRKKMTRRKFLKELGHALITPLMRQRLENPRIRKTLKEEIRKILGEKEVKLQTDESNWKLPSQKRCAYCDRKLDRKTNNACLQCGKPICDIDHRAKKCFVCCNNVLDSRDEGED